MCDLFGMCNGINFHACYDPADNEHLEEVTESSMSSSTVGIFKNDFGKMKP